MKHSNYRYMDKLLAQCNYVLDTAYPEFGGSFKNVDRATLSRWKKEKLFSKALKDANRRYIAHIAATASFCVKEVEAPAVEVESRVCNESCERDGNTMYDFMRAAFIVIMGVVLLWSVGQALISSL